LCDSVISRMPDHVARPHVAIRFSWDFEVVGSHSRCRVRRRMSRVHAAAAQTRSESPQSDRVFGGDASDALCSPAGQILFPLSSV
jgi:hypothetical protein